MHSHIFQAGKYFITSYSSFAGDIPKETGVYRISNQFDILIIKTILLGNFLSKQGKYFFNTEDVVCMFPSEYNEFNSCVFDFKSPTPIVFKENDYMKFEDDEFILC